MAIESVAELVEAAETTANYVRRSKAATRYDS
jgi:hypothetical protein